jgi:hypothetical protein
MNNSQRMVIVIALSIIGLVLLFVMTGWGDSSHLRYVTRIFPFHKGCWITRGDCWGTRNIFTDKYVDPTYGFYVANGILGILLGLVAPICLWAVAAYIALGNKAQS